MTHVCPPEATDQVQTRPGENHWSTKHLLVFSPSACPTTASPFWFMLFFLLFFFLSLSGDDWLGGSLAGNGLADPSRVSDNSGAIIIICVIDIPRFKYFRYKIVIYLFCTHCTCDANSMCVRCITAHCGTHVVFVCLSLYSYCMHDALYLIYNNDSRFIINCTTVAKWCP